MELPIPPACKAQIKGERLCDLPGVNNIYTTFPNLCICKLLVSHLNRLQLELVMLGVLHTSWRINAAAQSFFLFALLFYLRKCTGCPGYC